MAKATFVSFKRTEELLGENNIQLLVGLGLIKRGAGSVLALKKGEEWVNSPLTHADKVMSYLRGKLYHSIPTPFYETNEYKNVRIGICNDINDNSNYYSCKVWVDLISRDCDKQLAYTVIKGVYKHLKVNKLSKEEREKLNTYIGKLPEHWKVRICKTI